MHSHSARPIVKVGSKIVLILVVMEDALARLQERDQPRKKTRLNPCCNGRCTRTPQKNTQAQNENVLILVVMEDALAPQNLGYALFKRIVRLVCAS